MWVLMFDPLDPAILQSVRKQRENWLTGGYDVLISIDGWDGLIIFAWYL